ncbi:MAG: NAD-dependent deacylase [Polyangiaceae bacterium]|nr:NAD-dependent deacylase [Polyangiaceae bacterium]
MASVTPLDFTGVTKIVVLTGAGISVASGLRPYRGPGGLWEEHPELADIATGEAAKTDPMAPWRAFGAVRAAVLAAEPNPAHLALANLEARLKGTATVTVITQNVDGLHQRAGSQDVVEFHGALRRTRCSNPDCTSQPFDDDSLPIDLPLCGTCGQALRPDIVLFDEPIPVDAEWAAKKALRDCKLFLAVGTSGTVSPASNLVRSAEYEGARTVYVNLTPMVPDNPAFQLRFIGKAEEILPRLLGL